MLFERQVDVARALGALTLSAAVLTSASCSLNTTEVADCSDNSECRNGFGLGFVCNSTGWCAQAAPDPIVASSGSIEIAIPDATANAPGAAVVTSVAFTETCVIAEIAVDLDITHEWVGDLRIALASPSGTTILLHAADGEDGDLLVGKYPVSLSPVESLDEFLGEDGDGVWTLSVQDQDEVAVGTLHSFAVSLWCGPETSALEGDDQSVPLPHR